MVAEELRWCWYQFLEGKRSLFSLASVWGSSKRGCFLCSEINFDSSVTGRQFAGFFQYTQSEAMPGTNMTYYEYYGESPRVCSYGYELGTINNVEGMYEELCWDHYRQNKVEWKIAYSPLERLDLTILDAFEKSVYSNRPEMQANITFDPDVQKTYAVLFIREGKPSRIDKVISAADALHFETYFAYVLPYDEISLQCESLKRGSMQ